MTWITWPFRIVWFIGWFLAQVLISSITVWKDNLTPGQDSMPGVARYDSRCVTSTEVTLLGILVTLTPGTLTLGAEYQRSTETWTIFVHGMYSPDPDALRREVQVIESKLLATVRRQGEQS